METKTDRKPYQIQETYSIIRFRKNGRNRTIETGLTLEEAREHCSDPKTSGAGWFDGFTKE